MEIRGIKEKDSGFIKDMLYQAVYFPPDKEIPPIEELLRIPEINRYYKYLPERGKGIIAEVAGKPVGAAWYILFPENDRGYGFVEEDIPELTIAVLPEYRGRGTGKELLAGLLRQAKRDGFKAVSLSVDEINPAYKLYEQAGFVKIGNQGSSVVMKLQL